MQVHFPTFFHRNQVDSFLQQLIPEDMRSKMEVFLEQLKVCVSFGCT